MGNPGPRSHGPPRANTSSQAGVSSRAVALDEFQPGGFLLLWLSSVSGRAHQLLIGHIPST